MSIQQRTTLTQFLIEERRRFPHASGDFNALILDVAHLIAAGQQQEAQMRAAG